ncbi:MAG: HPr family phosphocarrier protein [Clostridia bacterium]|nr:HPr family phosphocarrier protein [Clostridia bacterium]MBO5298852.1 HPr family phosphocarrier protein [Clostridia bacterium]MBQ2720515.1 HPr family phosphocarrier protein [Clostridia bacterium]MBQ4628189.1 HPr family phosphocarrier protein [Clostridia bacterium]
MIKKETKKMTILLDSIDKVKAFVAKISMFPCDVDLISGRYTIDAKSIMGIFSLDLAKPIKLVICDPACENLTEQLKEFEYIEE